MASCKPWRGIVPLLFVSGVLLARGGWTDPPGGWDYVYEAAAGQAVYVAQVGNQVTGLLDASWLGGIETHKWDGSAPGQYSTTDPAGMAPGGLVQKDLVALGEGGGAASVLSMEVVGDTTIATGNPFSFAWDTPANESIYFHRGTFAPGATSTSSIKNGMTVIARWRLKPNPQDVQTDVGKTWRGAGFTTDGKGMISVVDQGDINASLSITDEGKLKIFDQTDITVPAMNPIAFMTTWVSVILVAPDTYRVEVYVNGSTTAAYAQEIVDPPSGDETGSDPDDYIAFGLPITGAASAMELDYIGYKVGFFRPGDTVVPPQGLGCAVDQAADPDSLTMTWTIPAGATYDSFEILRDGVVIGTVAADQTTFTTTDLPRGQLTYAVRAIAGGRALVPITCVVNYCPTGTADVTIDYTRTPPAAHVTWTPPQHAVQSIQVSRGGNVLTTLAATATEYFDSTLTRSDSEVTYEVQFVATAAPQCNPAVTPPILFPLADRPYLEPDGGWDYVYDPDAHNPTTNPMDKYVAQTGVLGALDGTWIRSAVNDFWDGSKPGDTTTPPDLSKAPGGIEILDRPGQGLGGVNTKTLSIEDPGNPTATYPDPSNRKIALAHLLDPTQDLVAGGALAHGITLYARFRITPDAKDVPDPPNGMPLRDGNRGQINLMYYDGSPSDAAADEKSKSWGMSLDGQNLELTEAGAAATDEVIRGFKPGDWVSVWVTLTDADASGFYHGWVYLNGATVAIRNDFRHDLDEYEDEIFADKAIPFSAVVVGMYSTDPDGAIEIDFIKIKYQDVAPQSSTTLNGVSSLVCTPIQSNVTLTWTNQGVYDSIQVLEGATELVTLTGTATQAQLTGQPDGAHTYTVVASAGGVDAPGATCTVTLPATGGVAVFMGNANGDATVNIADAVTILGYLFGKPPKPIIPCFKACDSNDDNTLNVADAVDLLTYLFGASANPAKPMTAPNGSAIAAGQAKCTVYPAGDIPATIIGQPGCATPCVP